MKNKIYLVLISLLFVQCSDDDNGPKGYFPKQISITTRDVPEITTELNLTYTNNNLISKIEFVYLGTFAINVNRFKEIHLNYTSNNDLSEIRTVNLGGDETVTIISHDDFGVVTKMEFKSDQSAISITSDFNAQNNSYQLNGSSAIFPIEFYFDHNDKIHSIGGSSIDNRFFNFNEQEKGIYQNLKQQPELIMWSEIFDFGQLNIYLNYLATSKLEKITSQWLYHRIFVNFELDNNENIIKFSSEVNGEENEWLYTISYEERNL
ncbi:hypothetical protein FF125_11740 [Aureibaculum algae]|uniref:DUF4595 domain-containing protein n=1 Tax=Aureibaculum algae TaxID=2584122 RepID=A0A5B7TUZ0_9FLAO|nr:hypothetical protein [Aureibaculum algae]QCX39073.1 hypothetical protein FF125_11740 [Aureibaculum algae]